MLGGMAKPRVDIASVFAANVRAERARRSWRQQDLADRCDWSVDTISAIERGARRVAVEDLPVLCGAFGISFARLLDGADQVDLQKIGLD
jgi:transcriptional regulator with XRE-family HTH domain